MNDKIDWTTIIIIVTLYCILCISCIWQMLKKFQYSYTADLKKYFLSSFNLRHWWRFCFVLILVSFIYPYIQKIEESKLLLCVCDVSSSLHFLLTYCSFSKRFRYQCELVFVLCSYKTCQQGFLMQWNIMSKIWKNENNTCKQYL